MLDTEKNGRDAVCGFLRSMAIMHTDPTLPGGCFIVNGTADTGGSSVPLAVELALSEALQGCEDKLRQRIEQAKRDGQLAKDANAEKMAALFLSLITGMAILAKGGAKRDKLNAAIDAAMAIWPASPVLNSS